MMKKFLSTVCILTIIILTSISVSSCKDKESKTTGRDLQVKKTSSKPERISKGRALSLKVLQEKAKDCMTTGSCPQDILQLYGIKRIMGYVIDGKNRDIILIGKIDDTAPALYLEDFVVALRNTWMKYAELKGNTYYYTNPGCSIDPDTGVLNELQQRSDQIFSNSEPKEIQRSLSQWHKICRLPQQVRVLGIPYDSRFGKVMVDADYYMKRLVDGSVTLDINGFESLTDMTLNIIQQDIANERPVSVPLMSLNRFWFYPGENSFLEDKGVIYIKRSDVRLLNEEEFLTKSGEVAGTGRPDPLADKFAQGFSDKYAEIAKKEPVYAELDGLFRFVALARIMKYRDASSEAGLSLDYLLDHYPVKSTPVSRTLPGISSVKEVKHRSETQEGYNVLYLWLPSCGGVSIDISVREGNIERDKSDALSEIRGTILDTRPSKDALFWDFTVV